MPSPYRGPTDAIVSGPKAGLKGIVIEKLEPARGPTGYVYLKLRNLRRIMAASGQAVCIGGTSLSRFDRFHHRRSAVSY